jgi:glutathione S-transferase
LKSALPILYSFRRCPYAIRARLAITYSGIPVEIREVQLKQKPEHMLAISPKGTVPVLQLSDGNVIDESLDIMHWALAQNDPEDWLDIDEDGEKLIRWNDDDFKNYLDRYKYADRFPEFPPNYYREEGEKFIAELERNLNQNRFISGSRFSIADAAILPFVRQFAAVESIWFVSSAYRQVNCWLTELLNTDLFVSVMAKNPASKTKNEPCKK